MKIKPTILNTAGLIQIIYSIIEYYSHGRHHDPEGWGLLATIILVAFGVGAIIVDIVLQSLIKDKLRLLLIEIIIIVAAWFFIYKY